MIRRCNFFSDHLSSRSLTARKSSSLGWVGGSPRVPKSSGVRTNPRPKCCSQTQFTITRRVSGLSGFVISLAKPRRRSPSANRSGFLPDNAERNRGSTGSPRAIGLPRRKTCAFCSLPVSRKTMARGGALPVRFKFSMSVTIIPFVASLTPRLRMPKSLRSLKVIEVGDPGSWR